jgi:hypothetical protein
LPPELSSDPIIVYGAPRSGTTYLQQLLNSHPEVFVSHETRVFGWLYHALEVLPEDERFLVTYHDAFVEYLRKALPEVIRDFYRRLAPDARYWGDKNPHYANPQPRSLEMIAELFPASVFIHIIRDGRGVVSSLVRKRIQAEEMENRGEPWVTFEQAHNTWNRIVNRGSTFGQSLPKQRYFELHYEDLVTDDVAVARELFGFLGLELHPAAEAFCRSQQENRTPFKEPMRDLNDGVLASDWPKVFSAEEQARSLELIGGNLVRFGYETENSLAELREQLAGAL